MIVDYHTHGPLCKHAEGRIEDYIIRAIELGLDEIGCSDHSPMPDDFDLKHRMTLDEYHARYDPEVSELTEKYGERIKVRRGIEADFFAGTENRVKGFLEENGFDYVIGSVHYLGAFGVDDPIFIHRYEGENVDAIYEQYFDTVKRSAETGLFDIIAHCDLVKKFGKRPARNMDESIRSMLESIKKNDLCLEINTSGLRKPVREVYPSESILSIAKELKIPLTLGSDAHAPDDVARDFSLGVELIERYGNGRIAVFEKRERMEVSVTRI